MKVAPIFAVAFWLILASAVIGTWNVPTEWIVVAAVGAPLATWVGVRSVCRGRWRSAVSRPSEDALDNADREIDRAKAALAEAKWLMIWFERADDRSRPELRQRMLRELDSAAKAATAARKSVE